MRLPSSTHGMTLLLSKSSRIYNPVWWLGMSHNIGLNETPKNVRSKLPNLLLTFHISMCKSNFQLKTVLCLLWDYYFCMCAKCFKRLHFDGLYAKNPLEDILPCYMYSYFKCLVCNGEFYWFCGLHEECFIPGSEIWKVPWILCYYNNACFGCMYVCNIVSQTSLTAEGFWFNMYQQTLNQKLSYSALFGPEESFGPFFFEDEDRKTITVTSQCYAEMINEFLSLNLPPNNGTLWFEQDSAMAHVLRRLFPQQMISRFSDVPWPPHSPDLTAPDFFSVGLFEK